MHKTLSKWTRQHSALLILWSVIAGCTVGPDYQPPQDHLPDHWSAAAPGVTTTRPAEVSRWWTVFEDPVLNGFVEQALRSNPDLRIAEARVREARARHSATAADLWPQLEANGSYEYKGKSLNKRPPRSEESLAGQFRDSVVKEIGNSAFEDSVSPRDFAADLAGDALSDALTQNGSSGGRPREQSLFQAGFDASWELDVFGGVRRSVEAADADAGAAREEYRDVLTSLLFEVARNYTEARGYQQRITIVEQNIGTQDKTLQLTRAQHEGGLTSELDVAQAQAQLSSTRSQVSVLWTSFRAAVHRLSLLMGELPDASLAEMSKQAPLPVAPPAIPLGLPSDLLRRRPDIRRSERRLAAATARIGVATADLFPRFSLTGSFGSETYDARYLLDSRSLAWSVGPAVSWKVFDAGRIRARIEESDAIQQQALARYDGIVLNAMKEVEDALIAYQNELTRHKDLSDAVDAGHKATRLANAQYTEGAADFLAVIDSERSLCVAQDRLVQSKTNAALHAIALFKALGGGWEAGAEVGDESDLLSRGGVP